MAELTKYQSTDVLPHIRHNIRELPKGKYHNNQSIDPLQTANNYSLIDRGKTAAEINTYRRNLEKKIFKFNRKNLVHAVEVVIQLPSDCPPDQEADFFKASYQYVVSSLPMGETCVLMAQIHKDEHKTVNGVDISKPHIHILYVPAVPDTKHTGFSFKLCADALTKKKQLKQFHPGLQAYLDSLGIQATVFQKHKNPGKTIALSVKQLKEITDKTGIVLSSSTTIDQIMGILDANPSIQIYDQHLLKEKKKELDKSMEWGNFSTWGTFHAEKDIERGVQ